MRDDGWNKVTNGVLRAVDSDAGGNLEMSLCEVA